MYSSRLQYEKYTSLIRKFDIAVFMQKRFCDDKKLFKILSFLVSFKSKPHPEHDKILKGQTSLLLQEHGLKSRKTMSPNEQPFPCNVLSTGKSNFTNPYYRSSCTNL